MDNLFTDINKIIARILSGEAEVNDILIFNNWLNQKEENKEEFLMLKSFWEAETDMHFERYPEGVYEQHIQKKINQPESGTNKKNWTYILSIAAIGLILLGTSAVFFFYKQQTPVEYYTYLGSGGVSELTLSDGTKVKLNKDSRLTYNNSYGKEDRYIQLEGEAYFDVTKDPEKVFKVVMGNSTIEVLGTKFNVQAYADKQEIVATLEEGVIQFRADNQQTTLAPNQQLIYHKQTGRMDVQKEVDTDLVCAWKDQLYRYHSISMRDLSKELEKIYGVEIVLPHRLEDIKVSGSFAYDQSIENVLGIMQKSLAFDWKKQKNKIVIR